ncbi:MAG TPA: hypothetical protein ENN35_04485 [Deltaproteobacteria bacterium]|nr:hypothetical protein [Deltaproteobacteria bacterium]
MAKSIRYLVLCALVLSLVLTFGSTATAEAPKGEPIVIGYVGFVLSPGTRPCMEIQRIAVEEINQAGGVLGRPLKYVTADNKGQTSLTVEGARHLLQTEGVKFMSIEGRTEICLAAQENSAAMFKEYPHILVFNGPMGMELTNRIVDDYERYRFCFRDWDPEPAQYAQMRYFFKTMWPQIIDKFESVAILWEDLAWTKAFREGIPELGLPSWEEWWEKDLGIDVVFSQAAAPRGTMYLPILQQMARAKPDVIYYISSWFTDTESFAKMWTDSAARDINLSFYGGVSQTSNFWQMTGGKTLGMLGSWMEIDVPITEKTIPFYELSKKHNIPTQQHVHLAYADIYFFKKVMEIAGSVDDIDRLITAMETTETEFSLGTMAYEQERIKPYFHSKKRVDPKNPLKVTYPGQLYQPIAQFQKGGEAKIICGSCPEHEEFWNQYASFDDYLTPAEARNQ